MRKILWLPALAALAGIASLLALRPQWGAGLSWDWRSLLDPPGAGGKPLQ
jgi:hypothetical protein